MKKKRPENFFKGKPTRRVKVEVIDDVDHPENNGKIRVIDVTLKNPFSLLERMRRDGKTPDFGTRCKTIPIPKVDGPSIEEVEKMVNSIKLAIDPELLKGTVGPRQTAVQVALEQEAARQRYKHATLGMRYGLNTSMDNTLDEWRRFNENYDHPILGQGFNNQVNQFPQHDDGVECTAAMAEIFKNIIEPKLRSDMGRAFSTSTPKTTYWGVDLGKDTPEKFKQEYNCNFVGGNEMDYRKIEPDDMHMLVRQSDRGQVSHGPGGYEWRLDIEIGGRSKSHMVSQLSKAFGLKMRTCSNILNMMRHSHLTTGGQDGKPFNEFERAVNNLTPYQCGLKEVKIMAPRRDFDPDAFRSINYDKVRGARRGEWLAGHGHDSVAYREIVAKYHVRSDQGDAEITLNFQPHFFNAMGEEPKQESKPIMNTQNQILNLIDESYTTVQVSYDLNHMFDDSQEERAEAIKEHYDATDGYTYKVLKTAVGELSVGAYVTVEARGELKTACIIAIHDESCIEDGRKYNWIVDTIRVENVARLNERDAKALAEIKQKEKAKQRQEMREHMAQSLGLDSLGDLSVKALGHVEAEDEQADTAQGSAACDVAE